MSIQPHPSPSRPRSGPSLLNMTPSVTLHITRPPSRRRAQRARETPALSRAFAPDQLTLSTLQYDQPPGLSFRRRLHLPTASWSACTGSSIESPGLVHDGGPTQHPGAKRYLADIALNTNTMPDQSSILSFRLSRDAKQWAEKYRTEISASTSGVLITFAAFPLDFAKCGMQSYDTTFTSTVKDASKGLCGFWRGV